MAINILKNGNPGVFVKDKNLGQDGRAGHPALSYDVVDVVTFDDNSHRNQQGLQDNSFEWTGLFNGNATGSRSYQVIKELLGDGTGAAATQVVSYYHSDPATGAAPGYGFDAARAFNMNESGGPGELLELSASIGQAGTVDSIVSMGTSQITANGVSTWVDLGPSSAAGGRFYLHLGTNQADGGNTRWTFTMHHASATSAATAVATGATATFGTGVSTGVVLQSTGQLRRFVRMAFVRDATTGTIDYQVGANRI